MSPVASQNPNGKARMWQSMRVLKRFTASDIAATADVSLKAARNYLSCLKGVGYLLQTVKPRAGVPAAYKLINDTGPEHPRIQKTMLVHDTNTGELHYPATPNGEMHRARNERYRNELA